MSPLCVWVLIAEAQLEEEPGCEGDNRNCGDGDDDGGDGGDGGGGGEARLKIGK